MSDHIYLGGEDFVQRMQDHAVLRDAREIPRTQSRPAVTPLAWYFDQHDRNDAIAKAFFDGGHTQTAIAAFTGLSVSRVSRLIKAREAKGKT